MKEATIALFVFVVALVSLTGCGEEGADSAILNSMESELNAFDVSMADQPYASTDLYQMGLQMAADGNELGSYAYAKKKHLYVVGQSQSFQAVRELLMLRQKQGYNVRLCNLSYIDDTYEGEEVSHKVRAFLQDTVDRTQENFILLLGSHDVIPFVWFQTDPAYPYDYGTFTDGYYADLHSDFDADNDGNYGEWAEDHYDLLRDAYVGRVPLDDPQQLHDWAKRVMAFEQDRSPRMNEGLLAGGYISVEGDTAVAVSLVREMVLNPAGYNVFTMLEQHPYSTDYKFLISDRNLNQDEFTGQMTDNEYGFVFWMSHGNAHGAYTLNDGAFILSDELDHLRTKAPTMYFSSACLQGDPRWGDNLAEEIMKTNAVSFVASTGETFPGALGGGSLIFMVAMDRVVVDLLPLAVGIDQSRDVYINNFWKLPYPRGALLMNYFGFTVFGDPTMSYPTR